MSLNKEEGLKREIGTLGLAAGVVNFIVGAGIFVLPAAVAIILGGSSLIAYVICGALILMIMLCFAEVGSKVTVSGGPYAYIQEAFGPFAGFLANNLFWFGYAALADAAIANAMIDMLAIEFTFLSESLYRTLFFLIIYVGFAWINIRGVKNGVNMVKMLTFVKLIPLVALVALGVFWVEGENLRFEGWPSSMKLGEACVLLFFAFGGGEGALSASGEIKEPNKTVPRGLLLGVGGVVILYILIQIVTQGVIGSEIVNYNEAPLAELATRIIGSSGGVILLFAAAISIFSTLSGSVMSYPRILYAGSKEGLAPSFLSKIHPTYASPYWAIIVYSILVFGLSTFGGFKKLAIVSSIILLLIYLGVVLATIRLRYREDIDEKETFKIAGGITIPVICVITIIWFLAQSTMTEVNGVLIFIAVLSVLYRLFIWKKRNI